MQIEQVAPKAYQEFKQILKKNRLNHAYLFSGDYANFDMAIFLAQAIFCQEVRDHLPCGKCRSCQLIENNEFSDVTILEPVGQVIKTDTVREMMRNFSQTGYESQKQVFIIRDCEKMHINAANSLLKFIEEPQSASYIFLLTNDDNQVLPTIKSRTQIFHFPKNTSFLSQRAQELGLLKRQANLIAQLAKSPRDLEILAKDNKVLELVNKSQQFASLLISDKEKAYLEASRLSLVASEKADQDMILKLLTLILSKDYSQKNNLYYLEALYKARLMWQSNVSFLNVVEFMVIS
ncbi:DNA polymerase III subunit delta' [Streptococcus hongkongensis]|nr:DNA polymerase III subunit delta' [Streptococcus uberis]